MPLWSHAEKQASICQRAVRQHRRSDNSSYSSVGRFSHQLHGTTTTLPADKNAKAFHRQNLRAFTRSDYNARLGGSFSRQHPASSRDQNDSDTNHHPYPAATSGGARTRILHFIFRTSNSGTEEKQVRNHLRRTAKQEALYKTRT